MAGSGELVVSTTKAVQLSYSVVVTTLGRTTLERCMASVKNQTFPAVAVIMKDGEGDTVSKMADALKEVNTELVAWIDDDAVYPDAWAESITRAFNDPKVAYASGTYMPLSELDGDMTDAERCIAEVANSFFGSTNMSQRRKRGSKTRDGDDTNLAGSGMYRTSVLREIFDKHLNDISPAACETFVIHYMRQMGFKTLYVPGGSFYHKQKSNIFAFGKQVFRSGVGRMNYFRTFPQEIPQRAYMLIPLIFLIYLVSFFAVNLFTPFSLTGWPLVAYVAFLMIASYGFNKHASKFLPLYFLTMHLSYGFGELVGIFKDMRTWR